MRAVSSPRRPAAARARAGAAAHGQPARSPAAERRGPHPLRRAGRLLPRQPARRLHGEELRRRVRDRPRDARDPLPHLQRAGRCVPARHAPAELGLPADRPGALRGRRPQPLARQRAVVPGPEAGVTAGEARPPHERGRGRLEAIDEDRLLGRPRAGPRGPGGPDAPRRRRPGSVGRDARAARRARRLHERRAGLQPRGPGLLRRRPQAHLLLLRAGGPLQRLDDRPRDRRAGQPVGRDRLLQRGRGHLPGRPATPASRATTSRARSATRPASATSTSGSSASTGPAATSPGSPPSTTTRAGRPRTPSSRPTGGSWPSRWRAPPTRPASATASCCCTSTGKGLAEVGRLRAASRGGVQRNRGHASGAPCRRGGDPAAWRDRT